MNDEYQNTFQRSYIARVARELQDPNSPINFLVHVRNRDTLSEVADWIRLEFMSGHKPGRNLTPSVQGLASGEIVKVSSRHPLPDLPANALIDVKDLNRFSFCDVIRLPPGCLVHNPGVFQEQIKTNQSLVVPRKDRSDGIGVTPLKNRQCYPVGELAKASESHPIKG